MWLALLPLRGRVYVPFPWTGTRAYAAPTKYGKDDATCFLKLVIKKMKLTPSFLLQTLTLQSWSPRSEEAQASPWGETIGRGSIGELSPKPIRLDRWMNNSADDFGPHSLPVLKLGSQTSWNWDKPSLLWPVWNSDPESVSIINGCSILLTLGHLLCSIRKLEHASLRPWHLRAICSFVFVGKSQHTSDNGDGEDNGRLTSNLIFPISIWLFAFSCLKDIILYSLSLIIHPPSDSIHPLIFKWQIPTPLKGLRPHTKCHILPEDSSKWVWVSSLSN